MPGSVITSPNELSPNRDIPLGRHCFSSRKHRVKGVASGKRVQLCSSTERTITFRAKTFELNIIASSSGNSSRNSISTNDNSGNSNGSYAQDIMGYSDQDINDAFDGDPEAYWNID